MGKSRVLGLRLVGFVESVVFAVDGVIDTIDEKINPVDEKFTSEKSREEWLANIPLLHLAQQENRRS